MKKFILIFFIFGFLNSSFAQNCVWARCAVNTGTSSSWDMANCTDKYGNIYVTGYFTGSVIFGIDTLTCLGNYNSFLVKYDPSGNVLWTRGGIGTDRVQAYSVACDKGDNVYCAGFFGFTSAVFETNTLSVVGNGGMDIFLVKYDQFGNLLWSKSEGGVGGTSSSDVVWATFCDTLKNVFLTGYSDCSTLTIGSTTLTNLTGSNQKVGAYIAKYDSSGNPLWARCPVGPAQADGGTVDRFGNSYMSGAFQPSVTFGNTTLTNSISAYGMFIAKYDPSGNLIWAKSENVNFGFHLVTNNNGDLFVTGCVTTTSPSVGNFTIGPNQAFVAKFNSNGIAQWAKGLGGSTSYGHSIGIDASGVYATGYLGSSSVSPLVIDNNTINIPVGFTNPNYLIRFDFFGNLGWVHIANGSGNGAADKNGVSTDNNGNIYYSANFNVSPFAVGPNTLQLTGARNVYLAKFHFTDVGIETNSPFNSLSIFPSPADKEFSYEFSGGSQFRSCTIFDATGKLVREIDLDDNKINVETLDPGIYFVRLEEKNGNIFVKKLCISR